MKGIEEHLSLIPISLRKWAKCLPSIEREELSQELVFTLHSSLQKYNPTSGVPIKAYLYIGLKMDILNFISSYRKKVRRELDKVNLSILEIEEDEKKEPSYEVDEIERIDAKEEIERISKILNESDLTFLKLLELEEGNMAAVALKLNVFPMAVKRKIEDIRRRVDYEKRKLSR